MTIRIALGAALVLAASVPAQAAARFLVGASAADITPPLAATAASNPANCDASGLYDGPHLFSLEEPYQDTNGNGRYDAGDPTAEPPVPPEPFLDCPTPTANGGVRPPDGRWDGIYLDGGSGHNRLPTEVLDPIWSRSIVVSNGQKTISITVADQEGVFKEIWDLVRQKVRADGVVLDEMFMSSTHDESAPDTIGIGGPSDVVSGVDPFYVEFMIAQTAAGIEQAAASMRPATIRFGQVHPDDLVPCWSSYPFVANETWAPCRPAISTATRSRRSSTMASTPRSSASPMTARIASTSPRTGTTSRARRSSRPMAASPSPWRGRSARSRCRRCSARCAPSRRSTRTASRETAAAGRSTTPPGPTCRTATSSRTRRA